MDGTKYVWTALPAVGKVVVSVVGGGGGRENLLCNIQYNVVQAIRKIPLFRY